MYCIKTEIPQEICDIDDELKAIYHSQDTVCIWVFKSRDDRNNFCLLYTSPSPRDATLSRMPSSA